MLRETPLPASDEAPGDLELEQDPVHRPDRETGLAREIVRGHGSGPEQVDHDARFVGGDGLRRAFVEQPGRAFVPASVPEVELVPQPVELVVGATAWILRAAARHLAGRDERSEGIEDMLGRAAKGLRPGG